jgi:hypothetical protein
MTWSDLPVEQQLAKALLELADSGIGEQTSKGTAGLRLSQQDLAAMIGAKKLDSVKKVIRQLKAAGTIALGVSSRLRRCFRRSDP